ncbi:MAG: carbohydrate kinase family protein [Burkholderiales bacterium]|nr:carbohydrate kinase family protein [Burkholderiales bacterium]MCE7878391.1 carbohydrate kinase family protein [Betaproteobacteria bacterium PRO3]
MKTLICGSLAYDTIMVFPDRFGRHILPDQAHMLSVSFTVGEMRREWGGCAGNIAYNLQAIGGAPVVMATLGDDGRDYRQRLSKLGIGTEGVRDVPGAFTAQAFIITDLDDNQITAFHPGAMTRSHDNHVADVPGVRWGIIAPDGRDGMLQHAAEFRAAGIPYLFDPGQGITLFDGAELLSMVDGAAAVACNDYEGRLLCERTGLPLGEIAARTGALAITLGAEGSVIHTDGATVAIPAAKAEAVVDPTGCGDAYRAGLLYGLANGWDWERSGRLASTLGALKIASRGGQNHAVNRDRVAALYARSFGSTPW